MRYMAARSLRSLMTLCGFVFAMSILRAESALVTTVPSPVLEIGFDDLVGAGSPGTQLVIHTQFPKPDLVPGIAGLAWRTDGFSSWASAHLDLARATSFTVSAWVALESYPSDLERPTDQLSPASILNQAGSSSGFDVFIDTYGRWGLWLATDRGRVTLKVPGLFPLREWVNVVACVDGSARSATLYLDGKPLATTNLPPDSHFLSAQSDLLLGRSPREVALLNFIVNRINGAYDDVEVFDVALRDEQVRSLHARHRDNLPNADSALVVPDSRFEHDYLRPHLHPMPPANWTNEPHGLVRSGNSWHLFYQRTPNGPYKTQMHWGHMASDDLVTWRHLPDALWPTLQTEDFGFDMKGIWSGDVILENGHATAFYTSVNHRDRLRDINPGISVAVSDDHDLRSWRKLGPILNTRYVKDFRDPYVWSEGGTWHMIIGAALTSGGGLDHYVYQARKEGGVWNHQEAFVSLPYRAMDVGSVMWEMPVFERLSDNVRILVANPIGGLVSKYGKLATRGVYWTGRWEGGQFHPFAATPRPLDLVPGHLSPTVARAADGSLRAIGIVDERRSPQAQEDAGWAHTFSLPRTWFLMPDGKTLGQAPAPELTALRGAVAYESDACRLTNESMPLAAGLHAFEVEIGVAGIDSGGRLGLDLLASADDKEVTSVYIDTASDEVVVDKSHSTLSTEEEGPRVLRGAYDAMAYGPVRTLRAYVDGSVVDVFINDAAAFSFRAYPTGADSTRVRVFAKAAPAALSGAKVWPLRLPH